LGGGSVVQFSRDIVSSPNAVLRTGTLVRFTIDPFSPHNSLRAQSVDLTTFEIQVGPHLIPMTITECRELAARLLRLAAAADRDVDGGGWQRGSMGITGRTQTDRPHGHDRNRAAATTPHQVEKGERPRRYGLSKGMLLRDDAIGGFRFEPQALNDLGGLDRIEQRDVIRLGPWRSHRVLLLRHAAGHRRREHRGHQYVPDHSSPLLISTAPSRASPAPAKDGL